MKHLWVALTLALIPVSPKALDLIYNYEIGGGKAYYEKFLSRPTVPAWKTTSSGVTVGIGYDCGYNSPATIQKDFEGILPQSQIDSLKSVSGLKGKSAYYNGLPRVKNLVILPFDDADKLFKKTSLPKFSKLTQDAFGLSDNRLTPDCNGALVSLVFNRGSSLSGDSRKEMRWIKTNIASGQEQKVPSDIRSMKRLWSYTKLKGLHLRRDAEAKLFESGFK